jgi:hypothetical protein
MPAFEFELRQRPGHATELVTIGPGIRAQLALETGEAMAEPQRLLARRSRTC